MSEFRSALFASKRHGRFEYRGLPNVSLVVTGPDINWTYENIMADLLFADERRGVTRIRRYRAKRQQSMFFDDGAWLLSSIMLHLVWSGVSPRVRPGWGRLGPCNCLLRPWTRREYVSRWTIACEFEELAEVVRRMRQRTLVFFYAASTPRVAVGSRALPPELIELILSKLCLARVCYSETCDVRFPKKTSSGARTREA